jgi:CBS domain-containing protein
VKKRPVYDLESLRALQKRSESLKKIASFPYSEKLQSVMVSPVYTCLPEERVSEVVKEMSRREVSSVVIVNMDTEPLGILTERDILKRIVIADHIDIEKMPVSHVMTHQPVTLGPDDTIYRALSVLSRHGIKHLPITENGRIKGIVTFRQLLKLRHPEPMMMIASIEDATGVGSLREIKEELKIMTASKLSMGISAHDITVMLSLINQDIHRKLLELTFKEIGEPPLALCLFLTGSHGRMETLLTPDQDHGMIIEDSDLYYDFEDYFISLTRRFSEGLTEIGYPFCKGYIMSMNPTWRKMLSEWKIQINYWFENQKANFVRHLTLLFDSLPIFGDSELFNSIRDYAYGNIKKHYELLRMMHEEEGSHKVPLGLLGKFILEKDGKHRGELDIKRSGLIFVVEGIRILSLLHDIRETSTVKRIAMLVEQGFIHPDDGEYFESAYQLLLYYALKTEVEKALSEKEIDTFLNPKRLSSREREMLRHAFKAVSSLQDLVAAEFGELVV